MSKIDDTARRRAAMPEGTAAILNARSLRTAHRRLAEVLRPGDAVLDVGCGTGAITRGIAEAVAPGGRVVGVDLNAGFIAGARRSHAGIPGLTFAVADACGLPFADAFDLVTAARVLQWLASPLTALGAMARAARSGGRVIVLDYNHERTAWTPDPPSSVRAFYDAYLGWRSGCGMDNGIADHLAEMFARAGFVEIVTTDQSETTRRGEADFDKRIGMWAEVAASRGHQMVADGAITEAQRSAAECDDRAWIRSDAESQTLYLLAVEGVRPR
ncbi:MAG TPA: methyltransferase domain-containing protein [bacterium]|nr:methyltransferase domain-containing protein [bacterium]